MYVVVVVVSYKLFTIYRVCGRKYVVQQGEGHILSPLSITATLVNHESLQTRVCERGRIAPS